MDDQTIKEFLGSRIERASGFYLKDLEAIDEGMLGRSPGGVARVPFDFTYEVAFVNNRIAARLRGDDPGAFEMEGWMQAPDEFRTKSAALKAIKDSVDAVLAAWNALPASDVNKTIVLPSGETSPMKLADLCANHLNYHDAQLNYFQALHGDDEMHWD